MKKILFLLMMVASVASAHPRSDAELRALLIGTWQAGEGYTERFTPDGRWFGTEPRFPDEVKNGSEGWDIKDGQLIEIRPAPESARPYEILFLTQHECLLRWTHHGGGHLLWTR